MMHEKHVAGKQYTDTKYRIYENQHEKKSHSFIWCCRWPQVAREGDNNNEMNTQKKKSI